MAPMPAVSRLTAAISSTTVSRRWRTSPTNCNTTCHAPAPDQTPGAASGTTTATNINAARPTASTPSGTAMPNSSGPSKAPVTATRLNHRTPSSAPPATAYAPKTMASTTSRRCAVDSAARSAAGMSRTALPRASSMTRMPAALPP